MRHGLLGVEVVLSDGAAVARFGGQNMKDVAGYDTNAYSSAATMHSEQSAALSSKLR